MITPMRGGFDVTPDGKWTGTSGDLPVQSFSGTIRISPDGRKLIASVFDSSQGFEFWSLENFSPAEARS